MTSAQFPVFEEEFLSSLCNTLGRRRKSLSKKTSKFTIQKVWEENSQGRFEKLEGDIRTRSTVTSPMFRFHFWHDRVVRLDASGASKAGWEWAWTSEGRVVGLAESRDLGAAIERTIDIVKVGAGDRVQAFETIWGPLIANGPVEIKQL